MFLPTNREEMLARDWHYLDFLLITGDAYVDHPSFGAAIISRYLEHLGYRVGVLAQPDWRDADNLKVMGKPGLGVLITSGNLDSMLNHYTAKKLPRSKDGYSPNGKMGLRPDYAARVYGQLAREAFGEKTTIILGGIEASLRRFAHYDFWSDKVLPSVLVESGADLLLYGMAELTVAQVAAALAAGKGVEGCQKIPGLCYLSEKGPAKGSINLPTLRQVQRSKMAFAQAFGTENREQNFYDGKVLIQRHNEISLIQNPMMRPMSTKEMDVVYGLPYERKWHPKYDVLGGIPAFDEVRFSIISHRGCFGGCSFCALNFHQGRIIQNRSDESILAEVELLTHQPDFKGYIHDIGGPTANFREQGCAKARQKGACRDKQCLYPTPCKSLKVNHQPYGELLRQAAAVEGVKKVFVRSGLRFDYLLLEKRDDFLRQLCKYHISGQLKVAPEHTEDKVLAAMGKPNAAVYRRFVAKYEKMNEEVGKKQFLVPYFMAGHPGSSNTEAIGLACSMKEGRIAAEQVQLFVPTPGSVSTCMYYTGIDPRTLEPIFVPKSDKQRQEQRAILQYWNKKNHVAVRSLLEAAGRSDLIGRAPGCLVPDSYRTAADGTKVPVKNAVKVPVGAAKDLKSAAAKAPKRGTYQSGKKGQAEAKFNREEQAGGGKKTNADKRFNRDDKNKAAGQPAYDSKPKKGGKPVHESKSGYIGKGGKDMSAGFIKPGAGNKSTSSGGFGGSGNGFGGKPSNPTGFNGKAAGGKGGFAGKPSSARKAGSTGKKSR